MSWVIVGLAATTMLVMGLVLSFVLGWANRAFHVEVDPRVDAVIDALPGANCGGCGYVGCGEYAEAVVLDDEAVNLCTVGGKAVRKHWQRSWGWMSPSAIPGDRWSTAAPDTVTGWGEALTSVNSAAGRPTW